jgi:hypothetical protein
MIEREKIPMKMFSIKYFHLMSSIIYINLPPVKKIKYNKILTYILRSIFLEIPHLELPRWRKTQRDMNGKGKKFYNCIVSEDVPTSVEDLILANVVVLSNM